jgi:hypothetical protein
MKPREPIFPPTPPPPLLLFEGGGGGAMIRYYGHLELRSTMTTTTTLPKGKRWNEREQGRQATNGRCDEQASRVEAGSRLMALSSLPYPQFLLFVTFQ